MRSRLHRLPSLFFSVSVYFNTLLSVVTDPSLLPRDIMSVFPLTIFYDVTRKEETFSFLLTVLKYIKTLLLHSTHLSNIFKYVVGISWLTVRVLRTRTRDSSLSCSCLVRLYKFRALDSGSIWVFTVPGPGFLGGPRRESWHRNKVRSKTRQLYICLDFVDQEWFSSSNHLDPFEFFWVFNKNV